MWKQIMVGGLGLLLAISGCEAFPANWTVITTSQAVQSVGLPIKDSLLVVACDTTELEPTPRITPTFVQGQSDFIPVPSFPCGFWLIDAGQRKIAKIAAFQSPVNGQSIGLIWLMGGARFMFEQRSVFSTEADIKTFFFNGTTVENIPHQWRAAGVIPSPDGSYFVSESCEGSVNSGGSAYVIYETSTGHMQGQILTGTAPFNGCDEDRQIGYRSSYVFPLANGTDWVLSSVRALPTYLVLRICRKDGRCVPQKWGWSPLMSVLPYTSVHFQASSFGNAVTIYEAASHQLTTYLISHMKVLDTVWSPATS